MKTFTRWRQALQGQMDAQLLTAVCCERVGLSRLLLILGADPDVVGWRVLGQVSALSAACARENPDLVQLLLANGANPDGGSLEPCTPYERIGGDLWEEDDNSGVAKIKCMLLRSVPITILDTPAAGRDAVRKS